MMIIIMIAGDRIHFHSFRLGCSTLFLKKKLIYFSTNLGSVFASTFPQNSVISKQYSHNSLSCNLTQSHAISRNLTQSHAISCNLFSLVDQLGVWGAILVHASQPLSHVCVMHARSKNFMWRTLLGIYRSSYKPKSMHAWCNVSVDWSSFIWCILKLLALIFI